MLLLVVVVPWPPLGCYAFPAREGGAFDVCFSDNHSESDSWSKGDWGASGASSYAC